MSQKTAFARCQGIRLSGEIKSQHSSLWKSNEFVLQCDVANYDEVRTLREKIRIDLGSVDIVVNNAGLLTNISLLEGRPEDVMRVMKVNLVSQFWVTRIGFLASTRIYILHSIADDSRIHAGNDDQWSWPYCVDWVVDVIRIGRSWHLLCGHEIRHSGPDGWTRRAHQTR